MPPAKPGRPPAHTARKTPEQAVEAILEACGQVLRRHGYRGATPERIARRAGVPIETVYAHFEDIDEILDALIQQEGMRYIAALEENIPGAEVPIREAIYQLLHAGYSHHRLVSGMRTAMLYLSGAQQARRNAYLRQELRTLLVGFLKNREELRGVEDLSLAADVFLDESEGLTILDRVGRSPEELIDILTDALARYVEENGDAG